MAAVRPKSVTLNWPTSLPVAEATPHTVVTGGQALLDTLDGAAKLVKQLDNAPFVPGFASMRDSSSD